MERPLNVVYFTGDLGPGGSEAHLEALLERLDRSLIRPHAMLLRPARGHHRYERIARSDVPIHDLRFGSGRLAMLGGLARAAGVLRSVQADVLHTYGYPCNVYAALLRPVRRSMKAITSRRGNQPAERKRSYYRWSNRYVHRVVCVSTSAARFAAETEGLSPEMTTVIPNGVELARFRTGARRQGSPRVFGTHGRLREIKGTDLLLEAMGRLSKSRSELALRIAGAAEDAWGEALLDKHGADRGVEFLGETADVESFLHSLDVFVLPSRSEGMSMALLEAMACGLPVVATDVGSNREVLDDGAAGILVEPDPAAIAAGIAGLVDNPSRARALGEAARRRIESEFSLDRMVRRYEAFYRSLVAPDQR